MSPLKEIPKFDSEDEERDFWDTHDFVDYVDFSSPEYVDFSYIRPSSLDPNPFGDLVLILVEARPGWALINLRAIQVPMVLWRLLLTLANAPGAAISYESLIPQVSDEKDGTAEDVERLVQELKTFLAEHAPRRDRFIQIKPNESVALNLGEENVIVVKQKTASVSGAK